MLKKMVGNGSNGGTLGIMGEKRGPALLNKLKKDVQRRAEKSISNTRNKCQPEQRVTKCQFGGYMILDKWKK